MPTYAYKCDNCGHRLSEMQPMSAAPLRDCPECREPALDRLIGTGGGFIVRGERSDLSIPKEHRHTVHPIAYNGRSAGQLEADHQAVWNHKAKVAAETQGQWRWQGCCASHRLHAVRRVLCREAHGWRRHGQGSDGRVEAPRPHLGQGLMDRAERRRRTTRVARRRKREWDDTYKDCLFGTAPADLGRCRKKSPFDCGKANCGACHGHQEPHRGDLKSRQEIHDYHHSNT